MNLGEYGVLFRFGANYDMSAWTSLTLTFTKPDDSTLVVTNPLVTLGNVTVETPDLGEFLAHEYVEYTFAQDDINQAGEWEVYLTYEKSPDVKLISTPFTFTVDNPNC